MTGGAQWRCACWGDGAGVGRGLVLRRGAVVCGRTAVLLMLPMLPSAWVALVCCGEAGLLMQGEHVELAWPLPCQCRRLAVGGGWLWRDFVVGAVVADGLAHTPVVSASAQTCEQQCLWMSPAPAPCCLQHRMERRLESCCCCCVLQVHGLLGGRVL